MVRAQQTKLDLTQLMTIVLKMQFSKMRESASCSQMRRANSKYQQKFPPGSEPLTAGLTLVVLLSHVDGGEVLLQLDAVGEGLAALIAVLERIMKMSDLIWNHKLKVNSACLVGRHLPQLFVKMTKCFTDIQPTSGQDTFNYNPFQKQLFHLIKGLIIHAQKCEGRQNKLRYSYPEQYT